MRYDTRGNDDTDIWKRETAMLILIHNRRRAGQGRAVGRSEKWRDARERQGSEFGGTYSSRPHESLLYAYYESSQQSTQEHK